jgi:glycosyltransferase involved in cell wall biosynthesis
MKIGIIARGLTNGGVTRFVTNILRVLATEKQSGTEIVIFTDDASFKDRYPNCTVCVIPPTSRLVWDYWRVVPALVRSSVDVLVYPKTVIPVTHLFCRVRRLVVVHDLAYFAPGLNEYTFFDTWYMRLLMGLSLRLADGILAVSYATKVDIVKTFKTAASKIQVIHEGVEDSFNEIAEPAALAQTFRTYNIQKPYLFYCGSLSPRKNMLRTLQAFNELKELIPHQVYITGGQSWHDEPVLNYIQHNLAGRVHILGSVTDMELVHLYQGADLFLYPSLYEGFGLPILEAQACGVPVLTSAVGACAEVAGFGAELIDPYSQAAIKEGILNVVLSPERRQELHVLGRENLQRFSWSTTGYRIIAACRQVVS